MSLVRKKRGRPPGSKNKKSSSQKRIKTEHDSAIHCKICGDAFISLSEFDLHHKDCKKNTKTLGVTKKPKYHCKKCRKKFIFRESYENHLLNEHSEAPDSMPCKKCYVVCPDLETLNKHIEAVHERLVYKCDHCSKKFARKAHVVRHMAQIGCDGQSQLNFPCEICNKTFTRKDNLMAHLRLNHILLREFTCKICNFATNNFTKLIRHNQVNHQETPHFECDYCGKVTGSRAAIAKHLEIHGNKKYKCDVCGHNTFTIEVMRRHVLTHIPDKPHKCDICGSSYIQKLQLQRHMIKHVGFNCFKCSLTFDNIAKFISHDREHLKDAEKILCPFMNCSHSTKEIISKEEYFEHMKVHLTEKLYSCNVCGKAYQSETFLKRHVERHALERPRRCMYCVNARAYVRGEQLVRHVRKMHPDMFKLRLQHVRSVLGSTLTGQRVTKSEMESILNVLDAESERILQDYGHGVIYGGLQEGPPDDNKDQKKSEDSPLMTEEELVEHLKKLLTQLIDKEVLECFGWPNENVDTVLEKVIEQMGARVAPHERWTRVQRLRENTKHLFMHAVEDKAISRMLDTHTIDQVVKHILTQVASDVVKSEPQSSPPTTRHKVKKSP